MQGYTYRLIREFLVHDPNGDSGVQIVVAKLEMMAGKPSLLGLGNYYFNFILCSNILSEVI